MTIRNVNLTERFDQFVKAQVEKGNYADADAVLRAALSLLEQQAAAEEQKLTILRELAAEGFEALDRGEGRTFENEEQLREHIRQIGQRVANRSRI